MYSDAGRPKKSREDKQRELFLQKRSRKGLNKGKEMELQSGFRFRDVLKGGFFSESVIRFSNLPISKKKIPKNYPELEI